jgi:hypothetical protein
MPRGTKPGPWGRRRHPARGDRTLYVHAVLLLRCRHEHAAVVMAAAASTRSRTLVRCASNRTFIRSARPRETAVLFIRLLVY